MNTYLLLPVLFVLAALPVAILYRVSHNLKKKRFPFSDRILRPAGHSIGKKTDNYVFDLISILFACIFIAMLASTFLFSKNLIVVGIGVLLILTEVYLVIKAYKLATKLFNYNLGYAGELAVGQNLNQLMLEGYHVYHDLVFNEKFNIDHVIVGENGVFAVETKARTKPNEVDKKQYNVSYDGDALYFEDQPEFAERKFLEQSKNGAKFLSKELSSSTGEVVNVLSVLVLPGWYINYKTNQTNADVKVFNHNILESIKSLKTNYKLHDKQMKQINHQLKQKCCDLDMNRGRWGE